MRFFGSIRIPHTPIRVGLITERIGRRACTHCGNVQPFNWPAFWFGVLLGCVLLAALAHAVLK